MQQLPTGAAPVTKVPAPTTMWGKITHWWDSFRLDSIADGSGLMRVGLWFAAGFAAGFLFKKYFKAALMVLIVSLLLLKGLEMQQVVAIDWASFKSMLGLSSGAGIKNSVSGIVDLIKDNIVLCVAAIGGFLVGHQLG